MRGALRPPPADIKVRIIPLHREQRKRAICNAPVAYASLSCAQYECLPVAQLDRVPGYGPGGWGFESLRVGHGFSRATSLQEGVARFCLSPVVAVAHPSHVSPQLSSMAPPYPYSAFLTDSGSHVAADARAVASDSSGGLSPGSSFVRSNAITQYTVRRDHSREPGSRWNNSCERPSGDTSIISRW